MTKAIPTLSRETARRIAVAAQGFGGRTNDPPLAMIDRLGVLQLDSVNVLIRSHYLPLWSRLGHYERTHIDEAAYRLRTLFEYWGHEASLLPIDLHPCFRWRMDDAARGDGLWGSIARVKRDNPDLVDRVRDHVRAHGPIQSRDLEETGAKSSAWWGWSDGKKALEFLFWSGEISASDRRNFTRSYDLTERVIPPSVLNQPTPDRADAQRTLIARAARAMGVASETDLRDYYRLPVSDARSAIATLEEAGTLIRVAVAGWAKPAWVHRDAPPADADPHAHDHACLLSPFDSLIWERQRTERLFGFHYRLAFYTPAPKRVHGYYVMPFLLNDALVARVDVKADRKTKTLSVLASYGEADIDAGAVIDRLAGSLVDLADWLGLAAVTVRDKGDLAPALAGTVAKRMG